MAQNLNNCKTDANCTGIGGGVLIVAYAQVAFWLMTSHRQSFKIRSTLLRAVFRQEIGWFDTNDIGGISNRLSEYVHLQELSIALQPLAQLRLTARVLPSQKCVINVSVAAFNRLALFPLRITSSVINDNSRFQCRHSHF